MGKKKTKPAASLRKEKERLKKLVGFGKLVNVCKEVCLELRKDFPYFSQRVNEIEYEVEKLRVDCSEEVNNILDRFPKRDEIPSDLLETAHRALADKGRVLLSEAILNIANAKACFISPYPDLTLDLAEILNQIEALQKKAKEKRL